MKDADDVMRDIVNKGEERIGIREVLQCTMVEFGGPAGFAHELYINFDSNNVGSTNRIRILSDILRALQQYGEEDEDEDDLAALEATAQQLMQEAGGNGDA